MNKKQIALLAGLATAAWTGLVILKTLDIIKGWDKAEEAKLQHERQLEWIEKMGQLTAGLDKKLDTAKFWEQVTRGM
jgi:hypothetical protein